MESTTAHPIHTSCLPVKEEKLKKSVSLKLYVAPQMLSHPQATNTK